MTGHLSLANGLRIGLRDGFVLGRVAGCDLVIDDSKASRRHAKFHIESGVVEIEDLQSSNGTLLNEKPVTRRVLREGDRVQIGKTVLVFHEGEAPGGAVAAPAKPAAAAATAPTVMATPPAAPTPPAPQPARPAPAATSFDDNDLFDDAGATSVGDAPPAPPPPPAPRSAAEAPPRSPSPRPQPPAPAPVTPPPPPPAATRPGVVEFADEVVEVKKPASPTPAARPAAAAGGPAVNQSGSRVLQFSKQAAGKGLLADDMGQMSGGMRALIVLGVLALGALVVWLVKGLV